MYACVRPYIIYTYTFIFTWFSLSTLSIYKHLCVYIYLFMRAYICLDALIYMHTSLYVCADESIYQSIYLRPY